MNDRHARDVTIRFKYEINQFKKYGRCRINRKNVIKIKKTASRCIPHTAGQPEGTLVQHYRHLVRTLFYFIIISNFLIIYINYIIVRGNLVLRHCVPHFLSNSISIACCGNERRALPRHQRRNKNIKYLISSIGNRPTTYCVYIHD